MATLTFTTDFDWPTLLKKEPTISVGPSNYFNDVHHPEYEIDRTKRRLALTESFYEWFDTGRAFAIVRDNKDAQFARTLSVIKTVEKDGMMTEKKVHTSWPMYQSLLNIVKREGKLCQCLDEKKPCKLVGIFWRLEIPNLIVLYRHGANNPWEYVSD